MIDINATMIAQMLNFLILVIILRAVAYKPIVKLLQERTDKIQADIDKAAADATAAEKALKDNQAKLAQAHIEAQAIVDKAEKTAQAERDASVQATQKEIAQMKEAAKQEIQRERERAVEQLKGEMVSLSLLAAGKIVSKNIDAAENEALISEFIEQLDKDKIGDLSC